MDLVSVFCVNRENMEMSNSHLSVYLKDVDFGPNNVDNLHSFSYAAFTDAFTMFGLSTVQIVYYLFIFFSALRKYPGSHKLLHELSSAQAAVKMIIKHTIKHDYAGDKKFKIVRIVPKRVGGLTFTPA